MTAKFRMVGISMGIWKHFPLRSGEVHRSCAQRWHPYRLGAFVVPFSPPLHMSAMRSETSCSLHSRIHARHKYKGPPSSQETKKPVRRAQSIQDTRKMDLENRRYSFSDAWRNVQTTVRDVRCVPQESERVVCRHFGVAPSVPRARHADPQSRIVCRLVMES